jgi:hypothetical protein
MRLMVCNDVRFVFVIASGRREDGRKGRSLLEMSNENARARLQHLCRTAHFGVLAVDGAPRRSNSTGYVMNITKQLTHVRCDSKTELPTFRPAESIGCAADLRRHYRHSCES